MAEETPELGPADYMVYRSVLETGRQAHAHWKATGVVKVETAQLLDQLREVIPVAVLIAVVATQTGDEDGWKTPDELKAEEAQEDGEWTPPTPAEEALAATRAFGRYEQLREALDQVGGKSYAAMVEQEPAIAEADLEWVALSLAAGMAFAWIGKLSFRGALVAQIVSKLFYAAAVYFGFTAQTTEGKNVLTELAKGAGAKTVDLAKGVGNLLLWIIGGATIVAAIGVGIWAYQNGRDEQERPRRRQLAERRDAKTAG